MHPDIDLENAGLPSRRPSAAIDHTVTMDTIGRIAQASERIIERLHTGPALDDDVETVPARSYTITEVAKLLDRTPQGIRKAEASGKLAAPERKENSRRHRQRYGLASINAMRELWDLFPGRRQGDAPIRMAFQNFKGGVGKTTLTCHCAQFFARAGYRVLLVDCDSQASATMTFGFRPDVDIDADGTLLPYLQMEREDLRYAVRPTRWDGLDVIPANLELYSAEYYLAASGGRDETDWISRLHTGLETVESDYDLVLIDPPPALGMISLSVLRALDGLIVPAPPAMYDFHSTSAFLRMLEEVMGSVGEHLGTPVELDFLKVVTSKYSPGRPSQDFMAALMGEAFGRNVLLNPFIQSAEIDNAAAGWKTVYDLEAPTSSRTTYRRCVEALDAVFGEVEELVQAVWESRRSGLTLSGRDAPVDRRAAAVPARPAVPAVT